MNYFFFFTALYSPNLTESARSNLFKVPVRVDFKLSSILSQNFIKKDGQKVESKLFNTFQSDTSSKTVSWLDVQMFSQL